jgi:aminoglycoside phosphotransferase (APT) family kinase protein
MPQGQPTNVLDTRDLTIGDPAPPLAPTTWRILGAARRILDRDGFDALTFEAVGAESGENRTSLPRSSSGSASCRTPWSG